MCKLASQMRGTKTSERTLGHLTQNTKTETQNKKIL